MGLDLWFQQDVARILAATYETMDANLDAVPASDPKQASTYRKGFEDALRAVGVAFGVAAPRFRHADTPRRLDEGRFVNADDWRT